MTNLVLVNRSRTNPDDKELKADKLEKALRAIRSQIELVEGQYPNEAIKVKSKILGEFLRTGLVVIDRDDTRRRDRVQLDFSPSIVEELERRQGIINVYSRGGTICL